MELSQTDKNKLEQDTGDYISKMELYLVSVYEDITRQEARKLIWEQIKKIMSESK